MFVETGLFWLARIQLWLAACAAMFLSLMVFAAAVMRYVLGSPWNATEEVVGFLFFSAAFLSFPAVTWEARHIRLNFVDAVGLPVLLAAFRVVAVAALVAMLGMLVWVTVENAEFSRGIGALSEITRINLFPWLLVAPVSLATMLAIVILRLFRRGTTHRPLIDLKEDETP